MTAPRVSADKAGWQSVSAWTPQRPLPALFVYWALFAVSIAAFVLSYAIGDGVPGVSVVLALASSVTCGLSWLLARALFRPADMRRSWPQIMVAGLFVTGALLTLAGSSGAADGSLLRVLANAHGMIGSTVLILTLIEAADGAGRGSLPEERRFRFAFLAGYSLLLAVGVIWFRSSPASAAWEGLAQVICAMVVLTGGSAAVWYRSRHPLSARRRNAPGANAVADLVLADRISGLIETDAIYRDPDIKVADLSRRLGQPDYKVTQCITGPLGFANFNRLMNHYRIIEAKDQLRDPDLCERSILTIAMECGFGSIGPFNRAFKDSVGMTPRQFRQMAV